MKVEIQSFTSYFCSSRYSFQETWFNKSVVIFREEKIDDEWSIENSLSIPKDIFGLMKSKGVPPSIVSSLGTEGLSEENFHVRTIGGCSELLISVRDFLFRFDCEDIPLSGNQLGFLSNIETVEWFWEIVSNLQYPRLKEVTPPSPLSTPFIKIVMMTIQYLINSKLLWSQGLATFLNVLQRQKRRNSITVPHFHEK